MSELIRARNHGVNPEFIQELRHQGYDSVSLDDLIRLRNHGVTAEFIQRMKSQGFPSLSIEQLVKLRKLDFELAMISRVLSAFDVLIGGDGSAGALQGGASAHLCMTIAHYR